MLLKNAKLLGQYDGYVKFGKTIQMIGKTSSDGIDLKGAWVLPGFIDTHVHLRAPGNQSHKEDYRTGGMAAAHGGVTQVFDMPNKSPAIDSLDRLRDAQDAARDSPVKVGHYILATKENVDIDYPYMKIVYGGTTGVESMSLDTIEAHLAHDRLHFVHVERESDFIDSPNHCLRRPATAEHNGLVEVKARALKLKIPRIPEKERIHFTHLSTALSVALAEPYSCDVTIRNLFKNSDYYNEERSRGQVNPPLRRPKEMKQLRRVMYHVYNITTDHSPHTLEEKASNNPPSGMPGLDTYAPKMMQAIDERWMNINAVLEKCVYNPARLMGLQAGLEVGYAADMIVLERTPWEVTPDTLETKCGWSPYEGETLNWKVKATIVDGKVVYGKL